jgi:hypothetical protein
VIGVFGNHAPEGVYTRNPPYIPVLFRGDPELFSRILVGPEHYQPFSGIQFKRRN